MALAGTETITVKITGSQTEVGKSGNTYEITWGNVASTDYDVKETVGELEVTKITSRELKVASKTESWQYNGEAHTAYEYQVTLADVCGDLRRR